MATGRIGTTPVLTTRWSKAPAAGTTSLSGLDDNSVSLVYSVGYEQVYLNGALLSRTNDYTATNGTTITLTNATVAGDIVEVFANAVVPLTDTYTQTVANGKFINNTLTTTTGDIIYASAANTPARLGIGSTGNVLTVSGGVPAWAAPTSGLVRITGTTFSAVSSVSLPNNTFTSTYRNYRLILNIDTVASSPSGIFLRMRASGSDNTNGAWYGQAILIPYTGNIIYVNSTNGGTSIQISDSYDKSVAIFDIGNPQTTQRTAISYAQAQGELVNTRIGGAYQIDNTSFDALTFLMTAGTMTGRYDVYGYANS